MKLLAHLSLFLVLALAACTSIDTGGTIAQLRNRQVEIRPEKIEGGIEKAIASYQRFLADTPDANLTPEAIRRLADLKVEKEYGTITGGATAPTGSQGAENTGMEAVPETSILPAPNAISLSRSLTAPEKMVPTTPAGESEAEFENRAAGDQPLPAAGETPEGVDDLERAGALEAVTLYQNLLDKYPLYERNDQVLYQMSRAYEELGRTEEAMRVMDRLVREYPTSRYLDEVQFRRAEYFFTRRHYLEAEEAYQGIVTIGVGSSYFPLALYKLGWTFYKQELYEESLHRFIALLDYKVSTGYDFEQTEDDIERKRTDDTFRVISLSFSNLGGADAVVDYFARFGSRTFEHDVYSNLAEYYFDKRRYNDAVATYSGFATRNPFHRKAPNFHMRIIEINMAGGFPSLVIDAKKAFCTTYGLKAAYWQHFVTLERPEVIGFLKTNLKDLANHYHAFYQSPKRTKEKAQNFAEAHTWYRQFLESFPADAESPMLNYQLADLLLQNHAFGQAAVEYEKTAYTYPPHNKSSTAGYAAVYAYRQQLGEAATAQQVQIRREVVRSSLKFADTYPEHEKAAVVLGAAADDLYAMEAYADALATARKLVANFPAATAPVRLSAWQVIAHASYELELYPESEAAYDQVLALLPADDKNRDALIDNLAAAIYKQGELARTAEDDRAAADHFLRVAIKAPISKIRPNAEYDAAAALIRLKDWAAAETVLVGFRRNFPGHKLQPEVTQKIAYVYREDGKLALAAAEYEQIATESQVEEVQRESLEVAAKLYKQVGNSARVLAVYRRYVVSFPEPVEANIETRNKIAELLKRRGEKKNYLSELQQIVSIDAGAGPERTDRTRYLAAFAALVLAEEDYDRFVAVRLVNPIKVNLGKKQQRMKTATQNFNRLLEYEVGEVTAATTYYLAEIYFHFSKALMNSERPELTFDDYRIQPGDNLAKIARHFETDMKRIADANDMVTSDVIIAGRILKIPRGLYPEELEQYELALEEQAYPFEEKAIAVHQSNLALMKLGVYNRWIDRSLEKLAVLLPARYARTEEPGEINAGFDSYSYGYVPQRPAQLETVDPGVAAANPAPADVKKTAVAPQSEEVPAVQQTPADPEPAAAAAAELSPAPRDDAGQQE